MHCAKVINICFSGDRVPKAKWEEFDKYSKEWFKGANFVPTRHYLNEAIFPMIIYPWDYEIIGDQHYCLARILLETHDPNLPVIGPKRKELRKAMKLRVVDILKRLCGIGEHNSKITPALFMASIGRE